MLPRLLAGAAAAIAGLALLFLGYAAFDAAGDPAANGDWPTAYVVVAGILFAGLGVFAADAALRIRVGDWLDGPWLVVGLAALAATTIPFDRLAGSRWTLAVNVALLALAATALARASRRAPPARARARAARRRGRP